MRYFSIIVFMSLVVGCIPCFDNPITPVGQQSMDRSILGTWFWKETNETGYVHIGVDEKTALLKIIMVDYNRNYGIKISEFSGFTSELKGNTYLNLQEIFQDRDDTNCYLFLKYRVQPNSLGIALMESKVVENAITSKALKGEIKHGKWSLDLHITAGQNELQTFIAGHDKELFPEMNYLSKLTLPDDPVISKSKL